MGSKANPAVIGAFFVGALALAVTGVLVFGSGQLFKKTTKIVCFFSGDTTGLNVGAPVKFKGVDVGSVADIRIRINEEALGLTAEAITQGIRIPVVIEIDNDKLTAQGATPLLDSQRLKVLIDLGLRAQLASQSLVTGLLFVQLDFHPDVPAVFLARPDAKLPELPTVPTSLQVMQSAAREIISKLEEVKFGELVQSATEATDAIRDLLRSPGMEQSVVLLPDTVKGINRAFEAVRAVGARFDTDQGPLLLQSLKGTSDTTGQTMTEARSTLARLETMVEPTAPLVVDLAATLKEVAAAARAVRLLADSLERQPGSLVRGKATEEK